uniref:Uncharacterized protein n=1 Tax=Acrobeloides nanus TaxID=290746 RepID=A0A914C9I0_9BILA
MEYELSYAIKEDKWNHKMEVLHSNVIMSVKEFGKADHFKEGKHFSLSSFGIKLFLPKLFKQYQCICFL